MRLPKPTQHIGAPRFELGRYTPSITLLGTDIAGVSGDNDGASEARPERLNTHAAAGSGRRVDAERPRWASGGTESRRRKRGAQPYGLLYAIEPQYLGPRSIPAPLKIGYTRDQASLEQRRATLQTSHWLDLAIVWVATGTMEHERLIHRRLEDEGSRIRGEWFRNGPDVWDVLLELAPRIEVDAA